MKLNGKRETGDNRNSGCSCSSVSRGIESGGAEANQRDGRTPLNGLGLTRRRDGNQRYVVDGLS